MGKGLVSDVLPVSNGSFEEAVYQMAAFWGLEGILGRDKSDEGNDLVRVVSVQWKGKVILRSYRCC